MKNKSLVLILLIIFLLLPAIVLASGLPNEYYDGQSTLIRGMFDKGVPLETIYLILILPIIVTVIAFARQIIGLTALGVYTPSMIAISFLVIGVEYGLVLFLIAIIIGSLGRSMARKIRLSYLPRLAMVLSLVSFAIFGVFWFSAYYDFDLDQLAIFPVLVMVLLTEKFISVQVEQGNKRAAALVLETLVLSVACFFLVNWSIVRTFILDYPLVVLLTLVVNFIIGKWTGLRLFEFYRFRKVIKHVELVEKK